MEKMRRAPDLDVYTAATCSSGVRSGMSRWQHVIKALSHAIKALSHVIKALSHVINLRLRRQERHVEVAGELEVVGADDARQDVGVLGLGFRFRV